MTKNYQPKSATGRNKFVINDLSDCETVKRYLIARLEKAIIREQTNNAWSKYDQRLPVLRRAIYQIGVAYINNDKTEVLRSYLQGVGGRKERDDSNVFSSLFRLVEAQKLVPGFSSSQCRKYAMVMQLACSWDVYYRYLDHFVDQMGGYDRLSENAKIVKKPSWLAGITKNLQLQILDNVRK